MAKSKHMVATDKPPIDWSQVDVAQPSEHIEAAIAASHRPTETDLAYLRAELNGLQRSLLHHNFVGSWDGRNRLHGAWLDCIGYAMLAEAVSEAQAEYHCPKSKWLATNE